LSRPCRITGCGRESTTYCFYIINTHDDGSKMYNSYGFCADHARKLRGGVWEVAK